MKTLDAVKISVIDLSLLAVNVNERESWAGHVVFVGGARSEEHTSELQSQSNLVCRLLLEKKKSINAESRTYRDGDDLISILSVHTLVCPLIRAELRGHASARVLAYYHSCMRLCLQAYAAA